MSEDEYGRVEIQAEYDDGSTVVARTRVLQADPRVLISRSLLLSAAAGELRGIVVDGNTVTISDDYGQRFVYRLGPMVASPIYDANVMELCQ